MLIRTYQCDLCGNVIANPGARASNAAIETTPFRQLWNRILFYDRSGSIRESFVWQVLDRSGGTCGEDWSGRMKCVCGGTGVIGGFPGPEPCVCQEAAMSTKAVPEFMIRVKLPPSGAYHSSPSGDTEYEDA